MERGDGGEDEETSACTTWWQWCKWDHVVQISARQETRITHNADAVLRSEIGEIGLQCSFLRAMHVPSL